MTRLRATLTMVGVACLAVQGLARAQDQAPDERARIRAERAAANARYTEQERACQERFIVTACIDDARKEQRQTLTRLRRAELVLDDAARREAAAKRRQELQERAAAQAGHEAEPATESPSHDAVHVPPAPNPAVAAHPGHGASTPAEREAEERRHEESYAARQRAAQEHRDTVERRNADRAREGKVAKPLPVPASGASAP